MEYGTQNNNVTKTHTTNNTNISNLSTTNQAKKIGSKNNKDNNQDVPQHVEVTVTNQLDIQQNENDVISLKQNGTTTEMSKAKKEELDELKQERHNYTIRNVEEEFIRTAVSKVNFGANEGYSAGMKTTGHVTRKEKGVNAPNDEDHVTEISGKVARFTGPSSDKTTDFRRPPELRGIDKDLIDFDLSNIQGIANPTTLREKKIKLEEI